MWYMWTLLVVCAAEGAPAQGPVATTRAPGTLDRQAAELAWRSWLQSPESGNQNAPPRRITTKSLFITPLVCPKGQRLDRNGCVQVVTVNKAEHERILLEQLNALFTSAPSGDVVYDYGDIEQDPGPYQLSIPIGLDPQAERLQAQEPLAQAQDLQPSIIKFDKKDEMKPDTDASVEAELELLKLHNSNYTYNDTDSNSSENGNVLNHNIMNNFLSLSDKPKRNSPEATTTESDEETPTTTEQGQKELVFGHVNVDPVLYNLENVDPETINSEIEKLKESAPVSIVDDVTESVPITTTEENNQTVTQTLENASNTTAETTTNSTAQILKKDADQNKLSPENDYSDIGEAIKLISRYAEVTTDDNFSQDQRGQISKDDSILGTRTRLTHRLNKPKSEIRKKPLPAHILRELADKEKSEEFQPKNLYYRYPWSEQSPTPPPDYPFRHIQDYWPGRNKVGGVYNSIHENPRRHHHSFSHNYFRPHTYPYVGVPGQYPGNQEAFQGQFQGLPEHPAQPQGFPQHPGHHIGPMRSHSNNQDLYSLLGLRHWFSSEGTSNR